MAERRAVAYGATFSDLAYDSGGSADLLRDTVPDSANRAVPVSAKTQPKAAQSPAGALGSLRVAFKNRIDVYWFNKLFFTPILENFETVFCSLYDLGDKLLNSIIVAAASVVIAIPIATCSAYAFSRFRIRGETTMPAMILARRFVPAVVIASPLFIMFGDIGLLNTRIGLILINPAIIRTRS